jgi:glycosyltransferase involved in cell wall biosynthesis
LEEAIVPDLLESVGDDGETLEFSIAQIEYLRSEFERQRRWVATLSAREKSAMDELDEISNSVSYRLGRFLTWPLRKAQKLFFRRRIRIHHFVEEEESDETSELFPSSLLITPELLPESGAQQKPDLIVEEILLAVRRHSLSVNATRDLILDSSFGVSDDDLQDALNRVMNHMMRVGEYQPSIRNVFVGALRALSQREPSIAIQFGEEWADQIDDARAYRTLIQMHGRSGNFTRPMELLKRVQKGDWRSEQTARFSTATRIIETGLAVNYPSKKLMRPEAKNILYHAAQSMPHSTSGYSIRTHGLVTAIRKSGWDATVHLRHGYPLDRSDFKGGEVLAKEEVEGTPYRFHPDSSSKSELINYSEVFNFSQLEEYQAAAVRTLMRQASESKPQILHSASNFVVGLAGAEAAKRLGIPSVYEIRGFWHLTQATKRTGYESSDHYTLSERLEIEAARNSDHVFTITNALRDILIEEGIEAEKVSVLPNAVDPERFDISDRDKELEAELGYQDKVVIGYIGSFVEYEGLELLLEAAAQLKNELGDIFRLMLVGDGSVHEKLRRMSRFLAIDDIVTFTGRVSYDEVERYYSLIDIVPLPRLGLRVCELVSPLKPFEAMGTGKVLITSDVAALAEIVDDGKTGLLHRKDDAEHLAEKLKEAITDSELRQKLGQQAREWVCETHSWDVISSRVTEVYTRLLEEKK